MKYNNFDLLRLIAAWQVMISHTNSHILIEHDYLISNFIKSFMMLLSYIPGVPIFFLISGYLIAMSYEKNSNLVEYTKNRLLRIYPALYLNIIIGVFVLYYFGFVQFNFEFFAWLIAQMSIVQFYNAEMFREFGVGVINGSLWTISVELTFYILLPLILYLYKKYKLIIPILFIFSFTIWIYDLNSTKELFLNKLLHVSIIPYLFLFFIGIYTYKYYNILKDYLENKFLIWLVVYGAFSIIVKWFDIQTFFLVYFFKWIIFGMFIFSFALSFKTISYKLLRGNDYTYGVYIYHMIIINIFIHIGFVGKMDYFYYVLALSMLSGILSWHLIEKPFLKLKKHSLFYDRNYLQEKI